MKVLYTIILGIIFFAFGTFAHAATPAKSDEAAPAATEIPASGKIGKLEIGVKTCQIRAYDKNNDLIGTYPAGTAAKNKSKGLPYEIEGEGFKIIFNPSYKPTKNTRDEYYKKHKKRMKHFYPPGPNNPLGFAKLFIKGLGDDSLGIHNTDHESSVGKRVSHGCVRMKSDDLEIVLKNILLQNGYSEEGVDKLFAKAMTNRRKTLPPIFLKVRPKVVYMEE